MFQVNPLPSQAISLLLATLFLILMNRLFGLLGALGEDSPAEARDPHPRRFRPSLSLPHRWRFEVEVVVLPDRLDLIEIG